MLRHLGIRPAKDRHQLMFGRAGPGEDGRGRLSETEWFFPIGKFTEAKEIAINNFPDRQNIASNLAAH